MYGSTGEALACLSSNFSSHRTQIYEYTSHMSNSVITKRALAAALKEMLQTTPLEKISIAEICQRCSLNRKSFYYHFHDKYELVEWIFAQEIGDALFEEMQDTIHVQLSLAFCRYLYENRAFILNTLHVSGSGTFHDYLCQQIQPLVKRTLATSQKSIPNTDDAALMVSQSFLSAVYQWLRRVPPEKPEQFLSELISVAEVLSVRIQQLLAPPPKH